MKKFLKVFIIVLLVIASVAGTCFFFFRNLKEKNNTTPSFSAILFSQEQKEFNESLNLMSAVVNSDATDKRLEVIIKTQNNLDEILKVLVSYHVENNTQINNERISKAFKQFDADKTLLQNMVDEYLIKKDSSYFDRHLGANDFYRQACNYLMSYARLVNYINMDLSLNKSVDLKFSMFEIYCNVVTTSFNTTKVTSSKVEIENASNINKINDLLVINDSFIVTAVDPFSSVINEFNRYYYNSNKTEFAKNLANNILMVNSNQGNNEQIATYYFKQIFGV